MCAMNKKNIALTQTQSNALECLFRVFPLGVAIDTMTKAYGEKVALDTVGTINALCNQIIETNAREKKFSDTAAKLAARRAKVQGNPRLK